MALSVNVITPKSVGCAAANTCSGWTSTATSSVTADATLNGATQKALAGDLRERFAEVGLDIAGGSPEQFAATIRSDMSMYARLVKESGMAIQQ